MAVNIGSPLKKLQKENLCGSPIKKISKIADFENESPLKDMNLKNADKIYYRGTDSSECMVEALDTPEYEPASLNMQNLSLESQWRERTEIITADQHCKYIECAKEIVEHCVLNALTFGIKPEKSGIDEKILLTQDEKDVKNEIVSDTPANFSHMCNNDNVTEFMKVLKSETLNTSDIFNQRFGAALENSEKEQDCKTQVVCGMGETSESSDNLENKEKISVKIETEPKYVDDLKNIVVIPALELNDRLELKSERSDDVENIGDIVSVKKAAEIKEKIISVDSNKNLSEISIANFPNKTDVDKTYDISDSLPLLENSLPVVDNKSNNNISKTLMQSDVVTQDDAELKNEVSPESTPTYKKSYSFNYDKLDDPDFNPFETKAAVQNSPLKNSSFSSCKSAAMTPVNNDDFQTPNTAEKSMNQFITDFSNQLQLSSPFLIKTDTLEKTVKVREEKQVEISNPFLPKNSKSSPTLEKTDEVSNSFLPKNSKSSPTLQKTVEVREDKQVEISNPFLPKITNSSPLEKIVETGGENDDIVSTPTNTSSYSFNFAEFEDLNFNPFVSNAIVANTPEKSRTVSEKITPQSNIDKKISHF